MVNGITQRSELLVGDKAMNEIRSKKVIIFGIGGVGSWCAESLVRTGIEHLTLVDSDRICITNVNRQLMATTKTVGQVKTDVLKDRLLDINPEAKINAIHNVYSEETSGEFHLHEYDYVIDCIDSLKNKIHLMNAATECGAILISSLGAALRIDPTRIKVDDFWNVRGCPFGSILRKRMRQRKQIPSRSFLCVYSDEVLENKGGNNSDFDGNEQDYGDDKQELDNIHLQSSKAVINGSLPHITAIFGFTIAGLVIKDIAINK